MTAERHQRAALGPRVGDTATCEYCDQPIVFQRVASRARSCTRWWHTTPHGTYRAACLDKPLDREATPRAAGRRRCRRLARKLLEAVVDRI